MKTVELVSDEPLSLEDVLAFVDEHGHGRVTIAATGGRLAVVAAVDEHLYWPDDDLSPDTRRFTFAPVEAAVQRAGWDITDAMQRLGYPRRYWYRWQEYGVDSEQADNVATRLGLHVTALWPDYLDEAQSS